MSYFEHLHVNVARMGKPREAPTIDTTLLPSEELTLTRELESGIEIALDQLEDSADLGGLLGYGGRQVLLYIREQGGRIDEIREKPFIGPKYHVANCSTLRSMRERNRFERYVVTNDVSGSFRLVESETRSSREVRAKLNVCKNCLTFLNYQGYRTDGENKRSIFEAFRLPTFFATYSTLFEFLPAGVDMVKSGDPRAWAHRANVAFGAIEDCYSCGVRLPNDTGLIGVPRGTGDTHDRVICVDCRRKPPRSESIHVSGDDMRKIAIGRGKLTTSDATWEEAYRFADSTFHGLMKTYERQGYAPPEAGFELTDENGAVSMELGLAWSVSRHAVVLHEREAELARAVGWEAQSLEAALIGSQEDG